jgi:RNA-directed DNA polymerase
VDSTNDRSTPATRAMRGTRTSTTATRTGTTSAITTALERSADRTDAELPTLQDLAVAYFDCRRTKRNTTAALAFERDLEANLRGLLDELLDGSYAPDPSICFVVTRPKPREVWAAAFRDRVVHHLLYNRIGPRFERTFIADSCACIKGRGTLYAAERLEEKIRSITRNWTRRAFYLKCDIRNFFVSIDKQVLAEILADRVEEPFWHALTETVLFHDPRPGAEVQSPPTKLALIPPAKSLWNQPRHLGLPIGNLSSQFFANVYLNVLDQYVKHVLGARHYIRYVDDFVILDESPEYLNYARAEIEAFLPERLHLKLNPSKTIIQPIARGVDFVGQVVKPWRRTLRRRTFNDAATRLAGLPEEKVYRSANSYLGLCRQAPHGFEDRARLAGIALDRGFAVDGNFTRLINERSRHGANR